MSENPDFLKKKYNLHASEEVEQAVESENRRRTQSSSDRNDPPPLAENDAPPLVENEPPPLAENDAPPLEENDPPPLQEGELEGVGPVPQDPATRIQVYLDRLHRLFVQPEERPEHPRSPESRRERNLALITQRLHENLLVTPDIATDEYLKRQQKIARTQGHGTLEIPDDLRDRLSAAVAAIRSGDDARTTLQQFSHNEEKQMAEEILALIEEQEQSLDLWVDELSSPDTPYPDWLKYWAIRNILTLSAYDKDAKKFPKRTERTINPFPDFNPEALSIILDAIAKKYDPDHTSDSLLILEEMTPEERVRFDALLAGESFPKLFAWAMEETIPASADLLETTEGQWVTYPQGSDHTPLVQSIRRRGTGWCTAGEQTAQSQLSRGDFHVYYSLDREGTPAIPRAAIRMEGPSTSSGQAHIAEVRGIAKNQNLDPHIAPVVQTKMQDFPDGEQYLRKAADMSRLTTLEQKAHSDDPLSPDDLRFLYETDHKIQGFGYQKDPRVKELRSTRTVDDDMLVIFDCTNNQIAHVPSQITEHTKAYVGQLEPGIFEKLPSSVEQVYTKFPEGRIRHTVVEIGGKTAAELITLLEQHGYKISDYARAMLLRKEFTTSASPESLTLITLTVHDLGFPRGATIDDIYRRAQDLGLDLAPAEAGPHLQLQYTDQPIDEWVRIGMQPIPDPGGRPSAFSVGRSAGGSWLGNDGAAPDSHWGPDYRFAFCRRK